MAGIAPSGALTFFASQKKVSKERRAAVRALRVPCAARSGRGRVQTRFAQTSTRPDPPAAALLSPARTAWRPFRALLRSPPEFKTRGFSGLVGTLGFFLYVHHQCSHQRRGCGLGRFGELASMSPSPQPRLWCERWWRTERKKPTLVIRPEKPRALNSQGERSNAPDGLHAIQAGLSSAAAGGSGRVLV